ncbi:hypothetical protein ACFL3P_01645 [Pseudomonadota bacterium]
MRSIKLIHSIKAVLFLCAIFLSQAAVAEVLWVPAVGVNMKSLEFDRSFDPSTTEATFIMADLTITAAFDDFYVQLNTNQPFSDEKTSDSIGEVVVERDDITLTVGCNCFFIEKLTLFVGYNAGTTVVSGAVPGASFEESYKDSGFFVGGSYPLFSTDEGGLTAALAYAKLDGTVHIKDEITSSNATFDGDTSGLSYGLTWTGGLTDSMNYSVSMKQQVYVFDTGLFAVDQNYTNISVSVTFFF